MSPLATLLSHPSIWRGNQLGRVSTPSLATGFSALDAELPGGGWPVAALTELLPEREGIGEIRMLLHAMANLTTRGRWIAWIAPPYIPYAPALQAAHIDLSRVLQVNTRSLRESLWAMELALRDNSCGAVIAWPEKISYPDLRRLQLAAAGSQALAVLFRPPHAGTESSPAALRLHLQSCEGDLAVRIIKRRGNALSRLIVLGRTSVICSRKPVVFNRNAVACPPFSFTPRRIVSAAISAV